MAGRDGSWNEEMMERKIRKEKMMRYEGEKKYGRVVENANEA